MPPPTFLQGCNSGGNFPVGDTGAITFGAAPTARDLIVVFCNGSIGGGDLPTVTDGAGNLYDLIVSEVGYDIALLYAWDIAGGGSTLTLTWPNVSGFHWAAAFEYSGILFTADPLDKKDVATGNSGAAPGSIISGNSVTPSTAGQLIFGAGDCAGSNLSPGPGFTERFSMSFAQEMAEDMVQLVAGPVAAKFATVNAGPNPFTILTATFKGLPPAGNAIFFGMDG